MKTRIFTAKQLKEAAQLIKAGELLAFPTETVYGLGADALNPEAVKKIFLAKGRPGDNPLIVHIAHQQDLMSVARLKPDQKIIVDSLIKKFWPGPLTIVLNKAEQIPEETVSGLKTVAVRMPGNKIALELIKYAGCPIAAPSANLSGKPSGTCFEHVFDDFDGKIAGIIKAKDCDIGLESTVLDLTSKTPILLRAGGLSFEDLKRVLPTLEIYAGQKAKKIKSPGMKYKHYSPEAKVILFESSAQHKIPLYVEEYTAQNKKIRVVLSEQVKNLSKELFKIFRQSDKEGVDYILISSVEETGIGLALMNRLRKAATTIVK